MGGAYHKRTRALSLSFQRTMKKRDLFSRLRTDKRHTSSPLCPASRPSSLHRHQSGGHQGTPDLCSSLRLAQKQPRPWIGTTLAIDVAPLEKQRKKISTATQSMGWDFQARRSFTRLSDLELDKVNLRVGLEKPERRRKKKSILSLSTDRKKKSSSSSSFLICI